ncbi:dTDP-4-amino-4,6-dideoxygalactose transaminase [Streptoalloteichus tenebrarius]|uniref:dTDP-4-amino-4,6-dideoxygalactose transaminase n=1 Tax=Streptoalloteichus tenebrarius (strain ATCC 17920 / DSM 40477 / JCM 4838 / CBS 697.72 / NBRC 16177 / NCIMB 11028 / NRRL B-12390 / A12253. 1 / ISP 5477) TaxID=1933 RepID=A0ABT1I3D5_STRSD|nr:DegT/DnrJ/EryC1/StrS family aminotransferase [Streptoalloteichus tenebrarius]MCP2262304.1 dTDP-4-amino-4,6-dideoxygalactose transaminase [Streptoalloteichus tenebrarius]BFF01804.1 DegT/DnrJ/EryC1/StrS family aminotransferase [Streptoalloteichus tenebrarius]
MIPITVVDVRDAEPYVLEVLRSGVIAQGPMVRRFEESFAAVAGTRHAVAVNNGTTALVAALQVLDLQPGDEVITSPFTFVATLNAILEAGATARFADIREDDFCVDPDAVAAAIGPRTKVLMPVHLYGQTADMGKLAPLAEEHGLRLVEDAAQAHGATFDGRGAGSFGLGCFSFYATKNITTGEGGAITTDDDALADRLRVLRNQGMRQRYQYEVAGHNYRMTDLQAALAVPQLEKIDQVTARRKANAERLNAGLAGLPGLRTPAELPGRSHVWHQYTVLVTDEAPVTRDELAERLGEKGIGHGVYYPKVVFDYDCYRGHPGVVATDVPVASRVARQCLSLPVHAAMSDADVDTVVAAVREVFGA